MDFAINYLWNFEESEVRETKKNMISLQLFSFSTFGNLGVDFSINRTKVSERLPILRSYTTFVYKFWLTMRYKTSLKCAIAMPLHQAHWHLQLQEFTLFKSERGPAKNPSSLGSLFQYVRKIFQKTNVSYPLMHTRSCAYQELKNVFRNILRTY